MYVKNNSAVILDKTIQSIDSPKSFVNLLDPCNRLNSVFALRFTALTIMSESIAVWYEISDPASCDIVMIALSIPVNAASPKDMKNPVFPKIA